MKSLEKLREYVDRQHEEYMNHNVAFVWQLIEITDEIEREIAERYMELPVDADGVPWHVGDMTENGNVVNSITFDRHGAHFTNTLNDINPSIHTHYKLRTVEDVLVDMLETAVGYSDAHTTVALGAVERYAAELRDLLGGDGR